MGHRKYFSGFMSEEQSNDEHLLCLLNRHRKNDRGVRVMLVDWANRHLAGEAEKMLRRFKRVGRFRTAGEIHNYALSKLDRALTTVFPSTVAEFRGLFRLQIRRLLLQMKKGHFGARGLGTQYESWAGGNDGAAVPGDSKSAKSGENPARRAEAAERRQRLHAALRDLPEKLRQVAVLRLIEEKPAEAVAAELGISRRTVARHVCDARSILQRSLADLDSSAGR